MNSRNSKKKSLLIYDTDFDFANDIKIYLEDIFRVRIVENIAELISDIKQYKADILLFEIYSLDQKSHILFNQVKKIYPKLKILLMFTYLDFNHTEEKLILSETNDFIYKPFDVNLLR